MRSISLHPASLAVGLVLALVCLLATAFAPAAAAGDTWPPAKRHVVNIFEYSSPPVITIPPGGVHIVYAVPSDRWLTVTGTSVDAVGGGYLVWAEHFGGVLSRKGFAYPSGSGNPTQSPEGCGAAVGWTFRPGSELVIENSSPTDSAVVALHSLIGYLSRD